MNGIYAGLPFEEAAKQYSKEATAARGGWLGFFGKGSLSPEMEATVESLKEGEKALTQARDGLAAAEADLKAVSAHFDRWSEAQKKEALRKAEIELDDLVASSVRGR